MFIDVHPDQAGHQKRMSKTADREQFSHTLEYAQKNQKPQSHASILFRYWRQAHSRGDAANGEANRPDYAGHQMQRQAFA
jgi:hypothetical protein